jgi:y4mF family transcriptional regulator
MKKSSHLSAFIKYQRVQAGLTQEELAQKAGVGLRFIRDLEQGKETLRIDKVNAVLALFGFELKSDREGIDPYQVWMSYSNKGIIITTRQREKLYGILVGEILNDENKIVAWQFVPNINAIKYQKSEDKKLTKRIEHKDIASIELQK